MDYIIVDTPPIANFSDDDKFRVVYAFGGMNTHVNNNIPEVTILLKEVSFQNNKIILNSKPDEITKIALNEVRIVSLMSIWKGKKKTNLIYKLELEGVKNFNAKRAQFDFDLSKPITIPFASYNENETINKSLIPELRIKLDQGFYLPSFLASKYLKITDINQRVFFIPTIEFLVSAYTFETQELTNQLVLSPIDDILNNELEKALIDKNVYEIELTKGREDTTEVFLAYAACNEITKKRIKAIRASIESSPNKYVSPTILPYHPHKVELELDCFKFEDNKYLVYKISGVSSPLEYEVESIKRKKDKKQKKQKKNEEMSVPINRQDVAEDIEISSNTAPHKLQSKKSVLPTVKLIGDTNHKKIKRKKQRQDTSKRVFQKSIDKDLTSLSSAEENSQQNSETIGKINYDNDKKRLEQNIQLKQLIEVIEGFITSQKYFEIQEVKVKIESFVYVTLKNNEIQYYDDVVFGDFDHRRDSILFFGRKYLLIELYLSNGEYLYLFEIERRIENGKVLDKFTGLIFLTSNQNKVTLEILNNLLRCSSYKNGVVSKCINKVHKGVTFKHYNKNSKEGKILDESYIIEAIEKIFNTK